MLRPLGRVRYGLRQDRSTENAIHDGRADVHCDNPSDNRGGAPSDIQRDTNLTGRSERLGHYFDGCLVRNRQNVPGENLITALYNDFDMYRIGIWH